MTGQLETGKGHIEACCIQELIPFLFFRNDLTDNFLQVGYRIVRPSETILCSEPLHTAETSMN